MSSDKPKILFVYDHAKPEYWMDGLWAALKLLEDDFEITRFNNNSDDVDAYSKSFLQRDFDFVLAWGAFGSRVDKYVRTLISKKKGLCVAGNFTLPEEPWRYDVLFYETDWMKENYLPEHPNTFKAFGVNTDLFFPPFMGTPIIWDYIGAGCLASWKRWELMPNKPGRKLVVGDYQVKNESESLNIARELLIGNVMVSNQMNPFDLVSLMHNSRTAYIPAMTIGGGERFVLEAKACGLNVEVEDDNPKLKELAALETVPDHKDYAEALKKGILSVL